MAESRHRLSASSDAGGFLALRSIGFTAGIPIRAVAVVLLAPVVDRTGITAVGGRGGLPPRVTTVVATRKKLLIQLTDRARELGAAGIVGVRFEESPYVARTSTGGTAVSITASGVPVTAATSHPPPALFRTAMSPTDVAALAHNGWFPADLLFAGTVLTRAREHRADDHQTVGSPLNREIAGATDLIQRARREIRADFRRTAKASGADGVLLHDGFETRWSSTLHLVEVSATANTIVRIGSRTRRYVRALDLSG